jgi:quercetin dioxygenase-like cupin family protein
MMKLGLHQQMLLSTARLDSFTEEGYFGPVRVLSAEDCKRLLSMLDQEMRPPLDWQKGYGATSRALYDIAKDPGIVDVATELLGDDLLLWGASIITREPRAVHAWHCDMESSAPHSRTVSVWLGLEHTTGASGLTILPYSHRFGATVQEVRQQFGRSRDTTSSNDVLGWARDFDKRTRLLTPEVSDGDALFFDGRLWHGSENLLDKTRRALLLQYAAPQTAIFIPDLNYLDWPFRYFVSPRPPCVMISGSGQADVNRVVSGPLSLRTLTHLPQLTSSVYQVVIPLNPDHEKGWKPYSILAGETANLAMVSCHASVLIPNRSPHRTPQIHDEEEVVLLLAGELDLTLPSEGGRHRLTPGEFAYYPSGFPHTLETVSDEPANYLILKWRADAVSRDQPLPYQCFGTSRHPQVEDGFRSQLLFEGPTEHLRKLHCHLTTLTPGAGYEPHVDAYDVAIIVLEGEVETLGERVGPYGVIFYASGEAHGMSNPGQGVASYLVFEFHGEIARVPAD